MAVKKTAGTAAQEGADKAVATPAIKATTRKPAAKKAVAKKPAVKKPAAKKPATTARKPKTKSKVLTGKIAAPVATPQVPPVDEPQYKKCGISLREALFCDHYLTHYNGTQALYDAGFKAANRNVAAVDAHKLMQKPGVRAYLAAKMKDMFNRLEDEQDKLLQTFTYTAFADPNELVENRIDCCRFCYGQDNLYQFTPQEFERHKERHLEDVEAATILGQQPPEFDPKGGIGFSPNHQPNADCPECFGRGNESVVFKDTRYLSPAALALYAGVSEGKDGKKMIMHAQDKARETLAKIRKLYDDNTTVNVTFDPVALNEKFGDVMSKAHARAVETMEERRAAREARGDD